MTYWYLATPYKRYPGGPHAAFEEACRQAGVLVKARIPVFCPIVHTHLIAAVAGLDPFDITIWLPLDKPLIDAACGLIVCKMDTWNISDGIREEINHFITAKKPVVFMEPGILPGVFLWGMNTNTEGC